MDAKRLSPLVLLLLSLVAWSPINGAAWDFYDSETPTDYQLQNGDAIEIDDERPSVEQIRSDLRQLMLQNLLRQQSGRRDNGNYGNDDIDVPEKRGRWQGFCFRRTRTGRRLPYICWRESDS